VVSKAKGFIVDDDDAVRDSLKVLLEVDGLDIEDYDSAEAFARYYTKPRRGCVILDQHLPLMTGLDFLMSKVGRSLGIPVVLLTGRGDRALKDRALAAGAAAYMEKPVAEEVLLDTIRRLVGAA
jgi:two-component system, LuxR family, response regulator FixJ